MDLNSVFWQKKKKWVTEYTVWWIFHKARAAEREDDRPRWLLQFRMRTDINAWRMLWNIAMKQLFSRNPSVIKTLNLKLQLYLCKAPTLMDFLLFSYQLFASQKVLGMLFFGCRNVLIMCAWLSVYAFMFWIMKRSTEDCNMKTFEEPLENIPTRLYKCSSIKNLERTFKHW